MDMQWVFISIGSNMGDSLNNCRHAIEALCVDGHVRLISQSPFYRTQPVDFRPQEWFVNVAVKVATKLTPRELLHKLKGIESSFGRGSNSIRFGPRVLDMDIILYGDLIVDTPELIIPHPRMHKRRFVLQPICDIEPSVVHPGFGEPVLALLNKIVETDQAVIRCPLNC